MVTRKNIQIQNKIPFSHNKIYIQRGWKKPETKNEQQEKNEMYKRFLEAVCLPFKTIQPTL